MPRRVYLLGLGLALVALALAVTDWALSLQPGVTKANAKRIRPGMTLRQVEAILGGPGTFLGKEHPRSPENHVLWESVDAWALVGFDQRGRVMSAICFPQEQRPPPLARLRAWLGW
jgi:hypothetical protein